MRNSICVLMLCLFFQIKLPGQTVDAVKKKRELNEYFLKQTLYYSPLSFATLPYCDLGSPAKWYYLTADIIPQFVAGGRWMKFPIHITPRFQVRMFNNVTNPRDKSFPVRTPGYLPGATFHIPIQRQIDSRILEFATIGFTHHSNGQDQPSILPDQTINTYNGNFSTNYFDVGFFHRYRSDWGSCLINNKTIKGARDIFYKIGAEIYSGTDNSLQPSYGSGMLKAQAGMFFIKPYKETTASGTVLNQEECFLKETWRLIFNAGYVTGTRTRELHKMEKRINVDITATYRIPSSPNMAALLTAGYYGRDPYNIYYEQNYFYLRVGIALGFFSYPGINESK